MAAPNTTVWKLEPHTQAKHEILRKYLNAWFPILGNSGFQTVLYIDGFSGPGRYSNGEDGSPVIAILAAINQRIPIRSKLHFRFIEKDSERANMLDQIVKESSLPANFDAKVFNSTFEKTFYELLNFYTTRQGKLPPTFAFIDPFGWTGSPFTAVREILSNPNCEVLFTFMYEEVNRFINHPDQENNFDLYFGTSDWKDGVSLTDPKKRDRFFHNLYQQQLRNTAKAKYVRSFQMRNKSNSIDYYLFYATNHLLGLKKMKEAMWKIDESGEFSFSDATDEDQLLLLTNEPNFNHLKKLIIDKFSGKEVSIDKLEEFIIAETPFRETHYKTQILRQMETSKPPLISVENGAPNRRHGTYSDKSLVIKFNTNEELI